MPAPVNQIFLIVLFVSLPQVLFGQRKVPGAAWLMPGASWHPAKNIRLQAQLGYNEYFSMGLFYPQAFITVHKNIILNPAYIYTLQKSKDAPTRQEHYLMNAVIFQASSKNFAMDDRNMLWNRLTVGATARHYYRNRLRALQSFKTWQATTKGYVYDEIFYLFNQKQLARNRLALGITSDLFSPINIDVTYVRQWDRYSGRLNLFFIMVFWQI